MNNLLIALLLTLMTISMVIILCYTTFNIFKFIKKNKKVDIISDFDFEEITKPLDTMINTLCLDYIKYTLEVKQLNAVNNKVLKNAIMTVSCNAISNLSDEYKSLLHKFYSEEGLNYFIMTKIKFVMIDYSIGKNQMK